MNLKKIVQLLCIMGFVNLANSQNNSVSVEYDFIDNSIYKQAKAILTFNDTESVFVTLLEEKDSGPELKDSNIFVGGLKDIYQATNKSSQTLKTYRILEENEVLEIIEKTPDFNWNLNYKEEKRIGGYLCKKATTKFRGREYTAWYYEEIPTFFGPWKFNGLPGLIIEIADITQTFSWKCVKIKIPAKEFLTIPYKEYSPLTIEEYIIKVKEYMEKERARVRGILPRGTQYKTPKNSRIGLELVYEWEKDE